MTPLLPWQRRLIATLTLGGNFTTIVIVGAQLLKGGDALVLLIETGFVLLGLLGVFCGMALFEQRPKAEQWCAWFWFAQVPVFFTPILSYYYCAGIGITGWLDLSNIGVHASWRLGSEFSFNVLTPSQPWQFGLNGFALAVALFLDNKKSPKPQATAYTTTEQPTALQLTESGIPSSTPVASKECCE